MEKKYPEFLYGRTSKSDAEWTGRPIELATPETREKIHDVVLTNRGIKVCQFVEAIGK